MPSRATGGRQRGLGAAQALAADTGWFVYPVSEKKIPLWSSDSEFPNGAKDASNDEEVIARLWQPFATALIAVRLDYSGLMAIDVDDRSQWAEFSHRFGVGPVTPTNVSLSGRGFHRLFRAPGCEVRKNVEGFPRLDFLHHHYIVVNQWVQGRSPWEVQVSDCPSEWLEVIRDQPKRVRDSEPVEDSGDFLRTLLPERYVYDIAGLRLDRRGFVACPGHEDSHASLKVYDTADRGWFCYQCQRGGSIYDFAALCMGLDKSWGTTPTVAATVIDAVWSLYERLLAPDG
jgi:Bifunctional DNA primase/polymerase, N-terminal